MNDLNALAIAYDRSALYAPDFLTTDVATVPECKEDDCSRPPYKNGRCKADSDLWDYRLGRLNRLPAHQPDH